MAYRVVAAFVSKLGTARAAAFLRIDPTLLEAYAEGRRQIPDSLLLKILDVLVVDAGKVPPAPKQ
jgi:hypothetical protein